MILVLGKSRGRAVTKVQQKRTSPETSEKVPEAQTNPCNCSTKLSPDPIPKCATNSFPISAKDRTATCGKGEEKIVHELYQKQPPNTKSLEPFIEYEIRGFGKNILKVKTKYCMGSRRDTFLFIADPVNGARFRGTHI